MIHIDIATVGLLVSGVSATAAVSALMLPRRRKLDQTALEKAKRDLADDDAKRNLERVQQDILRSESLRRELGDLSRISNERFQQWQDAIADLDELWAFIEDQMLPWQRKAYRDLRERGSEIEAPPGLPRRKKRHHDPGT